MRKVKENEFQKELIKDLKHMFRGCIVLKNDSGYKQGIPDLTILYKKHWAALECKRSFDSSIRPNQVYYIRRMNDMSYANFIFPENKEAVLHELQQAFKS